ncbi:anti-sigma factor family protein [Streptomyces spectabilis]|uniref:Zf-HC2 domain-containing protein n=1 Tax=Streptomyces spectabilis TaxID=68270 RepID=A0A516RA70_STRST|nr:hypothetical protein [Streptomyces spectabilis]QDQ12555.1 hypothetical protein FH965_19955 [Streptomyces spectabilis]
MTTTTDSTGHPDVSEISDLTEGLLSPSRTLDVRRHLDDCALCTDVYDSLEEIRGMLGTLPGPSRMPADVAERIDAALAAEALLDSTATESVSASLSAHGAETASGHDPILEPGREAGREPVGASVTEPAAHVSRETSASEPSEATASSSKPAPSAGTATGSGSGAQGPSGRPRAATGPGRGGRFRGRRRRTAALGAVFTAAALGLGALLVQPWDSDSEGSQEASAGRSASADAFSRSKLKDRVKKMLPGEQRITGTEDTPSPKLSIGPQTSPAGPKKGSTNRDDFVEIPACIERSLDNRAPLAADKGTYEGKSAYLVVVPHKTDGTKVSAYIVDAACVNASSPPDATGKVLLVESYDRN